MGISEIYAAHPVLFVIGFWVVSQLVLYAARVPIHRALTALGTGLGGALRLWSRTCRGVAERIRNRSDELLLESGRADTEKKIEREFVRVTDGFARELNGYPALHQKLDECATRLTTDLESAASSPPRPPSWPNAVEAVANIPDTGDSQSRKVLGEIKNMAVSSDKRALKEYREATARRHKILAGMAQPLKTVRTHLAAAQKAVDEALGTASRIDGYMDTYESIKSGSPKTARALAADHLSLFLVSLLVTAVAVGGAFVNFHLIALPMSELVPAGSRIAGTPVSTIAALVIVLMEVAAGIFVMEALGITELIPRIARLGRSRRRLILGVALTGLFLLAAIESSLAILREQIVAADISLKQSLAGASTEVAAPATSSIPVVGQAVLGFILPWILAMVALPLEVVIHSGRHVLTRFVAGVIDAAGGVLRPLAWVLRQGAKLLVSLFDVYVILPLQVERWMSRQKKEQPRERQRRPVLVNPADRTGEHGAVS